MTQCLDEEAILSFCRGSMPLAQRPSTEAHIAECDECRALVSAVVRSSLVEPRGDLTAPPRGPEGRDPLPADLAMDPTTPAQGGLGSSMESRRPSSGGHAQGASVPFRVGEILAGKYSVERVLGTGGMGVVVAARHTQLGQRVALKFLLPVSCETPGAIARFLREGKAAAQITSEHVARVVDTGVLENGAPYLVMEYLEGSDLGGIAARRGPLPPAEAVEYVLQACEAIVEAHQLGIVHRDLKPANLFLTQRKDGSPLVKVLDFGISKADGGSKTELTSTSMLMGSPRYMSPEQMVSARDVDARTDIWALGVILYELVTGKPVWHADTVQGLCALIASAPTPPLRQLAPHAPSLLEEVVFRCLAKSPDQRIASVADLARALEPIAPESARMSIERILRVDGRTRGTGAGRSMPPQASNAPMSMSKTSTATRPASNGRVVLFLSAIVGVVAVAGLVLSAVVHRRANTDTSSIPGASNHAPPQPPSAASAADPPPSSVAVESMSSPPSPPAVVVTSASTTAPARTRPAPPSPSEPRAPVARTPERLPSPPPRSTPADSPNRALSDRK